MAADIAEYLKGLRQDADKRQSERQRRLSAWHSALGRLYADVESWVKGAADCERRPIDIFEQSLGAYSAEEMLIKIEPLRVSLTPVGTMIIGAQGRVDMAGPRGTIRIIRLADESSDAWFVSVKPGNPVNLDALNEASFSDALHIVIDGTLPDPRSKTSRSAADA